MKKTNTNFRLFFNLLLMSGMVLFFSSCAREKGSLSYNNEKLRKQSLEIENSRPSSEQRAVVPAPEKNAPASAKISPTATKTSSKTLETNKTSEPITIGDKTEKQKVSPLQKLIAKKIAKKLESKKANRLDQKLKYAIIFGAVALIFFILAFIPFFWVFGAICLVIAIVFLLLWALEQ